MPIAHINNIDLYYEIHGEGFPLVCIAGFNADHMAWATVLAALSQQFKVILLDNRGVGQSDVPAHPYSIEQMSDDVYALCRYLNIDKAVVMGSSMGGFITQQLMRQHPDFIKASIIVNSVLNSTTAVNTLFAGIVELAAAEASLVSRIKVILGLIYGPQFLAVPGRIEQLIELSMSYPYPPTVEGMRNQFAALKAFDSRPWIHEIKTPTLVIGGAYDMIFCGSVYS